MTRKASANIRVRDVLPQYGATATVAARDELGMTGRRATACIGPVRIRRR